jgi:antitoxin VapB
MTLNIKNPQTDHIVRELAAVTGESVATAIRKSVEERLRRIRNRRISGDMTASLLEIGAHCAALPDLDKRNADEILGYDDDGLSH